MATEGDSNKGNDGNVRQQRQMNVCVVCVCVLQKCVESRQVDMCHVRRFDLGINSYVSLEYILWRAKNLTDISHECRSRGLDKMYI